MDFGESRKSLAVLGGMFSGLGEVLGKNSFKFGLRHPEYL